MLGSKFEDEDLKDRLINLANSKDIPIDIMQMQPNSFNLTRESL